jgi:hypothetical protein
MHRFFNFFFIIISSLLFLYLFYRSEIIWSGNGREYYYIYYVISIILIIFSLIFIYTSSVIKTYIIIIFFSTLVSLYSYEAYLNLPNDSAKRKQIKLYKESGKDFDTRTIRQVYDDLKKNDPSASVKVSPSEYLKLKNKDIEIYPLSGISNSKTVYQNENGYYMIYMSDRYGFNNPDKEWDSQEIEYLLIGDSFTHGAAVNRPDDIASQLRILSSKNVLNLGYSANGPLIEYAALREYAPKNIKNIIWLFTENDIPGLGYELENKILIKYLKNLKFTQNLKSRQDEVDSYARKMMSTTPKIDQQFKFVRFLKIYETRKLLLKQDEIGKSYSLKNPAELIKIIKLAKEYAKNIDAEFYFVYMPVEKFFDKNYDPSNYEGIKKIIKSLNINFIDINNVFDREDNPLDLFPFKMFNHYNPEGYRKVAKEIFDLTIDK